MMQINIYLIFVSLIAIQMIIFLNFKNTETPKCNQKLFVPSLAVQLPVPLIIPNNLSLSVLFQNFNSEKNIVELCSTYIMNITELKLLEPILEKRIWRLVLKPGNWIECLIRWPNNSWQHNASLKLAQHGDYVQRENPSVEQIIGYYWGFNSGLNSLARAIIYSVNKNKPVCVDFTASEWSYYDSKCNQFNFSSDCYFLRQPSCTYASRFEVRCGSKLNRPLCIWKVGEVWDSFVGVDDTLAARGFAVDWYLRLKPNIWQIVSNDIRNIKMPFRYIAVHARYGDKHIENRPLDIDTYFYSVCATAHRFNIYNVYVATDSNSNLNKLIKMQSTSQKWGGAWSCSANLVWYYNLRAHRHEGDASAGFIPVGVTSYDAMIDILVDIQMLRYATITLMTFSSNVGQISASLRMLDGNEKTFSLDEQIYWPK